MYLFTSLILPPYDALALSYILPILVSKATILQGTLVPYNAE